MAKIRYARISKSPDQKFVRRFGIIRLIKQRSEEIDNADEENATFCQKFLQKYGPGLALAILPTIFLLYILTQSCNPIQNLPIYETFARQNVVDNDNNNNNDNRGQPVILGWNQFWSAPIYGFVVLKWGFDNCSFECAYTEDKKLEKAATVVLFHGGEGIGEVPKHRRPAQLYTMVSWESPQLESSIDDAELHDYFNVTMSYHRNSTIYMPYEEFAPITSNTPPGDIWRDDEIRARVANKTKVALQFVSHCNARSGRDVLTDQLKKMIQLNVFGKCNGKPCDQQCYDREMDAAFFYMAFENAVCDGYVTEKFWNALRRLVVPVVLSRAVLKDTGIPNDTFIAADDFGSVEELTQYLGMLRTDLNKYMGYFNWTRKYRKSFLKNERGPQPLCQLCELAHRQTLNPRESHMADLDNEWTQKRCRMHFVQNVLFKKG